MVSMPHGPVLSRIYDEIKLGQLEAQEQPWYEYLTERQGNEIALRMDAPADELSEFERQVLQHTHGEYAHLGPFGLRRLTHALPEYEDPQGSSRPIDPITILKEEGWVEEEIQEALMDAREEVFLQRVCASV
jgi:hypothetical protein